MEPVLDEVLHSERVEVLTGAEVRRVRGAHGRFQIEIAIAPRAVDPARCLGCGACSAACPVSRPDPDGGPARKAIGVPYPGALPARLRHRRRRVPARRGRGVRRLRPGVPVRRGPPRRAAADARGHRRRDRDRDRDAARRGEGTGGRRLELRARADAAPGRPDARRGARAGRAGAGRGAARDHGGRGGRAARGGGDPEARRAAPREAPRGADRDRGRAGPLAAARRGARRRSPRTVSSSSPARSIPARSRPAPTAFGRGSRMAACGPPRSS